MTSSTLLHSLVLVVSAMTLIVIGDAAGKALTAGGVNPFFVAWVRFFLGALVLLPLLRPQREELRHLTDWRIYLRAAFIIASICGVLTALRTEPIANVFGGFFIGPIVAFTLSTFFLKEKGSLPRALLLAVGFCGVLLVVKPGFGMSTGMLISFLAGCAHGCYLTSTRWLSGDYRARFLIFTQLTIGGVVLTPLGIADIPSNLDMAALVLIVVSTLGSAAGNYLLTVANRHAPANVIAPLIYTQLIAATAVGFMVFGDWPDPPSSWGLLVITASGLGSLWLARAGR